MILLVNYEFAMHKIKFDTSSDILDFTDLVTKGANINYKFPPGTVAE